MDISRRSFFHGSLVAMAAAGFPSILLAQSSDGTQAFDPDAVLFTRILSQFVSNTSYTQLPAEAVMAAKRGLIDTFAVTLGASQEKISPILKAFAREQNGRGEATVIGGGFKTSANMAAYVNGALSHALDYDNVIHIGHYWMGHPSVVLVPAALAVAEKLNLSGKDLILAYAAGLEIYVKAGLLAGEEPYKNGWHNTSYIGTMAAAGMVARLMALDVTKTARSFGIAASSAGGLRQNFGTMTKPLHASIAARSGVDAGELAAAGFTGSENIFEGPLGYRNVFAGSHGAIVDKIPQGDEILSLEQFSSTLGTKWAIEDPGLIYKICPSCRDSHYGLEAGLEFRKVRPFNLSQLAEIECHVSNKMGTVLFHHDPETGLEGKFSLEYVLSRTLLDGVPKTTDFTDERVNESAVKALMKKMKWMPFEQTSENSGYPTFVFKSTNGLEYRTRIEHLTGDPERPVSNELLMDKFDDMAAPVISEHSRNRVKEMVFDLENIKSIRTLTKELIG